MSLRSAGWPYLYPPRGPCELNRLSSQAQGLVGLWPLFLNRGGGQLFDLADGNVMTPYNSPGWMIDGEMGSVATFLTASQQAFYVDRAVGSREPITLCSWFYPTVGTTSYDMISLANSGVDQPMLRLDVEGTVGGDPVVIYYRTHGGSVNSATAAIGTSMNAWHHAVGVVASNGDLSVYIDGGNKGTDPTDGTGADTFNRTCIGALLRLTPAVWYTGRIAECRIYDRIVSDSEVWEMYNPRTRWDLYQPVTRWWSVSKSIAVTPSTGTVQTIRIGGGGIRVS